MELPDVSAHMCTSPMHTHTHTCVWVSLCVPHPFCQQQEVLTGHKFARRLVNETLLYLHFFPARCFFFFSSTSTFSWLPLALAALLLALSNIFSQLAVAIFRLLPLKNGYLLSLPLSPSLSVCLHVEVAVGTISLPCRMLLVSACSLPPLPCLSPSPVALPVRLLNTINTQFSSMFCLGFASATGYTRRPWFETLLSSPQTVCFGRTNSTELDRGDGRTGNTGITRNPSEAYKYI